MSTLVQAPPIKKISPLVWKRISPEANLRNAEERARLIMAARVMDIIREECIIDTFYENGKSQSYIDCGYEIVLLGKLQQLLIPPQPCVSIPSETPKA